MMVPTEIVSGLAALDVLVVPAAGAAMLLERRFREFLASRVPGNRFRSYWAMVFSFPILLVIRRNLPRTELSPALSVAVTLAFGLMVVLLLVAIEAPARRLLFPLLLAVLLGNTAGLLFFAWGSRLALADHSAFSPLLYLVVVAVAATVVWLARRVIGPPATSGSDGR
jgi:hypothetical protein